MTCFGCEHARCVNGKFFCTGTGASIDARDLKVVRRKSRSSLRGLCTTPPLTVWEKNRGLKRIVDFARAMEK